MGGRRLLVRCECRPVVVCTTAIWEGGWFSKTCASGRRCDQGQRKEKGKDYFGRFGACETYAKYIRFAWGITLSRASVVSKSRLKIEACKRSRRAFAFGCGVGWSIQGHWVGLALASAPSRQNTRAEEPLSVRPTCMHTWKMRDR